MAELVTDNFLNEERFARSYARGKFNIKKWGRTRIKQELKKRKITDYCIRKAMEEIEEEDYEKTLHLLIEKKAAQMEDPFSFQNKAKIANYLIRRGFESKLVWEAIKTN